MTNYILCGIFTFISGNKKGSGTQTTK